VASPNDVWADVDHERFWGGRFWSRFWNGFHTGYRSHRLSPVILRTTGAMLACSRFRCGGATLQQASGSTGRLDMEVIDDMTEIWE